MKRIQSVAEFLSHEVDSWKHENLQIDGDTWIMKRSSFEPEVQEAFLYHIFKELAVQWSEIKKLKRAIFGEPGKIFQTRTHLILIDRSEITARKKTKIEEFTPIQITKSELLETPSYGLPMGQLLIEMKDNIIDDHSIPGDSIHLDISQLHFPLLIRNWKAGDQFQPNGMKGKHQKISAFLTNQKLSRIEREKVLVLTDSVKILWVIGLRKSHSDILSQENRTGIVRFTLIPK